MSTPENDAVELTELRAQVADFESPGASSTGQADGPTVDQLEQCRVVCQTVAGLVRLGWPVLDYPPAVIEEAARVLEPLTARPWFKAWFGAGSDLLGGWGAEINAAVFFGALVASSIRTVKESKRASINQAAPLGAVDENPFAAAAAAPGG